eukprot:scaffold57158_cov31-Tisochrysis_lutea.AAC.2
MESEAAEAEAAPVEGEEAAREKVERSTAITTFLRVRPDKRGSGFFTLPSAESEGPLSVSVEVPKEELPGLVSNKRTSWSFRFDGVLGQHALQDEVFTRVAQPVVDSVLEGFNGTVFAYGQTGSGKTYTLTGGVDAYEERGIIPRALSHIYAHIAASAGEVEHTVRISYLEIYNQVWLTACEQWLPCVACRARGLIRVAPRRDTTTARARHDSEEREMLSRCLNECFCKSLHCTLPSEQVLRNGPIHPAHSSFNVAAY